MDDALTFLPAWFGGTEEATELRAVVCLEPSLVWGTLPTLAVESRDGLNEMMYINHLTKMLI